MLCAHMLLFFHSPCTQDFFSGTRSSCFRSYCSIIPFPWQQKIPGQVTHGFRCPLVELCKFSVWSDFINTAYLAPTKKCSLSSAQLVRTISRATVLKAVVFHCNLTFAASFFANGLKFMCSKEQVHKIAIARGLAFPLFCFLNKPPGMPSVCRKLV